MDQVKFLVTGAAGFIGSNLVETLIESGFEVVAIDNESSECNNGFVWHSKADNYILDICDYESMRPLYDGVDYVIHMAAESKIPSTIEDPTKAVMTNTYGTSVVLQCAREAKVKRVVYSSTSAIYGNGPAPSLESDKDNCLNPYSASKFAGEKIAEVYCDLFDLEVIVFRYFNVYGNNHPLKGTYAPVIGIFEKLKSEGKALTIVGDGEQRRDFVHVNDVVSANIMASLEKIDKKYFGKPINIGTGVNYSVNEIAKFISDDVKYISQRPGEARETLANINLAKEAFGWEPTNRLEDYFGVNNG